MIIPGPVALWETGSLAAGCINDMKPCPGAILHPLSSPSLYG
jgi:hypothetical protein